MKLAFLLLVFAVLLATQDLRAQYVVSNYSDIGDSNLSDNIYFPPTLRSAIQNANYKGVAATIEFGDDTATIGIGTPLPAIFVPMDFKGDGLRLQPLPGSTANQGLVFEADNCKLRTTIIQNFSSNGLVWRGNDGLIENVTCRNNGNTNMQIWEAHRNTIGNTITSGYASNLIYGGQYGITLYKSDDNIIQFCHIGIDGGFVQHPIERYGIMMEDGHRNTITQNTIGGCGEYAIEIDGFDSDGSGTFLSSHNIVEKNHIGISLFSNESLGNMSSGIMVTNSTDDVIIDNVVSGNAGTGIQVQAMKVGSSTPVEGRARIERNRVGTNRKTDKAVPNGRGISVWGINHKVRDNVVSGNNGDGISVTGSNNIIQSNIVGLDSSQTIAVPNRRGIVVVNYDTTKIQVIGDTVAGSANIVAGNSGSGILVTGAGTTNVIVAHNIIGANKDTTLFPNRGSGVVMAYSLDNVTVRNNLIAADSLHGIHLLRNVVYFLDTTRPPIYQRPKNIYINDNCIGCTKQGDTVVTHAGSGIYLLNTESVFIDHNTIVGVAGDGITVTNDSTKLVTLTRNHIGSPTPGKGVAGDGIHISGAQDVLVGSHLNKGDGNVITYCSGHGVSVQDSGQMVNIFNNVMIDNALGGIALDDLAVYFSGGAFNDHHDADTGSNGLQNTPEMLTYLIENDSLSIGATFNGKPETTYRIDIYLAKELTAPDEHRIQGTVPIGWFTLTTNAAGLATIDTMWVDAAIAANSAEYPFPTMTVSGVEGTSAFSHLGGIPGAVDISVEIDTTLSKVDANGNVTIVAYITNEGTDVATTVAVRDTVSSFELKEVTISKGVALIVDSTFVATIPSLANGEKIEYTARGKATVTGPHHRRVVASPAELDGQLSNNSDTITLFVAGVGSVHHTRLPGAMLTLASARTARITGHSGGMLTARIFGPLGQHYSTDQRFVTSDEPLDIRLQHGLNIIEVLRDGAPILRKFVYAAE